MHMLIKNWLRKIYRYLLRPFQGVNNPISPEKIIRSIPERSLDPEIQKHLIGMNLIRHADVENYSYSKDLPQAFRTEMHFAQRHLYRLRDVSVRVPTGACAAESLYFQESYGSLRSCILEKPFPVKKGCAINVSGPVTCVHSTGYYHFLLEKIPRLIWALRNNKDLEVIVHNSAQPFVFQVFELLRASGRMRRDFYTIDKDAIYVSEYVFTQAEAYSGFVHSMDIAAIREELLPADMSSTKKEKIYISRRNSSRSFDNEKELEDALSVKGFLIVSFEKKTVKEQMKIMSNARIIVAPHGAGLANVVWCNKGQKIIEIFSDRYTNDCYARLCGILDIDYTPAWAKPGKKWGVVDIENIVGIIN